MANTALADIINPLRGWRQWYVDEIYTGDEIEGKVVPNVDDAVFSYNAPLQRIIEVDYTTGLSRSIPVNPLPGSEELTEADVLLGAFPGSPRESQVIYLDDSILPRRLSFDSRLRHPGTEVAFCKVILGSNIDSGEVISRMYDNNGVLLGENIPLVAVPQNPEGGAVAKVPANAFCSKSLPNNELVTAIFYNQEGNVVSFAQLTVYNTKWIRDLNESVKYVSGIHLESPHMSDSDNKTLNCPINLPMSSIMMRGVVTYTDGTRRELPIDGTKFYLMGLHQTVSTQLGFRRPFSLSYRLANDEKSVHSTENPRLIVESYTAVTTKVDGAYSVKLFSYPEWVDGINGYRLRHWLYNLERAEYFEVTQYVELTASSPSFEPLGYGFRQNLHVALDLSRVSDQFNPHRHLQNIYITLRAHATELTTNWSVNFDKNREDYGINLAAVVNVINQNLWEVDITCGIETIEEWVNRLYRDTKPIYDETAEIEAPEPNYFRLTVGNFSQTYPISMWNTLFRLSSTAQNGQNVYIHFFRRTGTEDLQLAVAAIPSHHQ